MEIKYHYYFKNQFRPLSSLSLHEVAYLYCEDSCVLPLECPDAYTIYLVRKGKGIYTLGESEFPIEENDVFVMYPNVAVRCSMCAAEASGDPWELKALSFDGVDARLLLNAAGFEPKNPVRSFTSVTTDGFSKVYDGIYTWRGQELFSTVQSTSMIYLMLASLVKTASWDQGAMPPGWTGTVHFQKAIEYVSSNYMKPINVTDIAKYVNLSRSRLYQVFMQQVFISPQQYLTEYRIREAIRLLELRKGSIKEIANAVGYDDPLFFSRFFKQVTGRSPKNYMKNLIESKST